jgi:phosphatidylinositol glycan class B
MIGSFLFFFVYKPKSVFTWMLLPFLLVHFLIGHKELRFLFPIANIIPLIFVLAVQDLEKDKFKNIGAKFQGKYWKWFVNLFVIINMIYLINVCFRPADYFVPMYKYIFENYKNQQAVLMYEGKDPYARGPEIANFYKSKNLTTVKISDTSDIENTLQYFSNEKVLYLSDRFLLNDKLKKDDLKYKKVYQNLPKWIESFNYNHWLERTTIFTIYEVKEK